MARAGFYAVHGSKIRFGRDGRWYADGEPITNDRIAALFATHLRREADGRYVIRMGDEQATIEVEDTAFVIVGLSVTPDGDVLVELNDHTTERLDPSTLVAGTDNVLYCRVKDGSERARFLRPAYYQLAPYVVQQGSGFQLRIGTATYPIRAAAGSD